MDSGTAAALVEQRLALSVQDSLHLLLYDNARFLCERLVAMCSNEHNLNLLALCYFHCNQAYRSYHLLKGLQGAQSRYLFALCCMQLGKVSEARDALRRCGGQVPNGAAGHYLLGKASKLTGHAADAKEHFAQALRLDPLMWCAYEELCGLGADDQAADVCAAALAAGASASSLAAAAAEAATAAPSSTASGLAAPWPSAGTTHLAEATPASLPMFSGGGFAGTSGHLPATVAGSVPQQCLSSGFHMALDGATGGFAGAGSRATSVAPSTSGMPMFRGFHADRHGGGPYNLRGVGNGALFSDWQTPAGPDAMHGGGFVTPAGVGLAAGGAGLQGREPAAGLSFETPMPAAVVARAPAPPQKDEGAFGRRQAQRAGAGASSSEAAGDGGEHSMHQPGGRGGGGMARLLDDGKVRKVSGRLFQEPSRRSTRLAAKDGAAGQAHSSATSPAQSARGTGEDRLGTPRGSVSGATGGAVAAGVSGNGAFHGIGAALHSAGQGASLGPGTAAGGGGAAVGTATIALASVLPPTYHECQNLPDPDHPPAPPSTTTSQLQAYVDAKLRGGTPVSGLIAAGAGAAGDTTARVLLGATAGPPGPGQGQGCAAGAHQPGAGGGSGTAHGEPSGGPQCRGGAVAVNAHAQRQVAALALALTQVALLPLMEGCRHLAMFRCKDALQALRLLPKQQYQTAWVLSRVGRAHFERTDYAAAAAAFEAARGVDRHCLDGMDLYSTALWHLRRGCELSYLAQEVLSVDRLAPQAWCVLGNLCSLQKEHDSAVQLFQRAIQLDPRFTYAYTLAGHEYSAGEDQEKALACYRHALQLDQRHYNAMFGIGQIFLRQEKHDLAVVHFKSAANINPCSSVLQCYVGMTLHRQGQHERALSKLSEAIALDPKNPLARFEKAGVLEALDRTETALSELQHLSQLSPGEPSVYFQMGRLYKKLGDLGRAQQQLELALSFKSSGTDASAIKAAIEKLGFKEEDEDDDL